MIRVEMEKNQQGYYWLPLLHTQQGKREMYYDQLIILAAHGHLFPTIPNNDIINGCFNSDYQIKPKHPDPNEGRARCTSL